MAHFSERSGEFAALGARIFVIGNGAVTFLNGFQEHVGPGVSLYTDPSKKTYQALSLVHGFGGAAGLGMIRSGVRAWKKGFRQGRTQGDPLQQGGVFVVKKGGGSVFEQRSKTAGDHPEVDDVLAVLAAM